MEENDRQLAHSAMNELVDFVIYARDSMWAQLMLPEPLNEDETQRQLEVIKTFKKSVIELWDKTVIAYEKAAKVVMEKTSQEEKDF